MRSLPFTVSISGADGTETATLLGLFPRNWPLVHLGCLEGDAEVAKTIGCEEFSDEVSVTIAVKACQRVSKLGTDVEKPLPGFALDRSGQMYWAMCVAKFMTTQKVSVEEAISNVDSILSSAGRSFPTETVSILIKIASLQQPPTPFDNALQRVLDYQVAQGVYTVISKSPNEPLMETLYKITAVLQDHTGKTYTWRPLLSNIKLCVAYGGLSECGKSSMCTATVRHEGDSAFRVKISYLCDLVSARLGQSIYEVPTDTRAIELVHELDLFVRWHRWLTVVTLDSLHNYQFTLRLAQLIGNRVQGVSTPVPYSKNIKLFIVYIDTPLELRISRTEAQGVAFDHSKDTVKMSRGAHKIEQIADLVVKNDGTFQDMFDTVWTVATKYGTP
jgi:hypothetical protein